MSSSGTKSSSTGFCCCSCSKKREKQIFAAKTTKIRVEFQAPGWLFGSGTPSPELLARSRDFDHVEHWPRNAASANACTVRRRLAGAAAGSTRKDTRTNEKSELFRTKRSWYKVMRRLLDNLVFGTATGRKMKRNSKLEGGGFTRNKRDV